MRTQALILLLAAAIAAPAARAACEMPALVGSIPDGSTATEQELLAAQSEVQAYIAAMDQYIACQNEEMTADEEGTTADYLYLMSLRIESAREEVDKVAADFNDQVNAFRSARQASLTGR